MRKKGSNIFFTSDTHFNHCALIKHGVRDFKNLDHMRDVMKENWNRNIKPGDIVYVLGDVFHGNPSKQDIEYFRSLNGIKKLIRGNHDMEPRRMRNIGFSDVCEEMVLRFGKIRLRLSHYPYRQSIFKYLYFRARFILLKLFKSKKRFWCEPFWKYLRRPNKPLLKEEFLIHGHTHAKTRRRENMINMCPEAWGFYPVSLSKIINMCLEARQEYDLKKRILLGLSKRRRK